MATIRDCIHPTYAFLDNGFSLKTMENNTEQKQPLTTLTTKFWEITSHLMDKHIMKPDFKEAAEEHTAKWIGVDPKEIGYAQQDFIAGANYGYSEAHKKEELQKAFQSHYQLGHSEAMKEQREVNMLEFWKYISLYRDFAGQGVRPSLADTKIWFDKVYKPSFTEQEQST
jgi:hypothetical protein